MTEALASVSARWEGGGLLVLSVLASYAVRREPLCQGSSTEAHDALCMPNKLTERCFFHLGGSAVSLALFLGNSFT